MQSQTLSSILPLIILLAQVIFVEIPSSRSLLSIFVQHRSIVLMFFHRYPWTRRFFHLQTFRMLVGVTKASPGPSTTSLASLFGDFISFFGFAPREPVNTALSARRSSPWRRQTPCDWSQAVSWRVSVLIGPEVLPSAASPGLEGDVEVDRSEDAVLKGAGGRWRWRKEHNLGG
ncbi:hypothetical protein KC325_g66 [Hortaea werneckii]|nr:hypothetical protein KC325_g66 [Hortaea werneckii]